MSWLTSRAPGWQGGRPELRPLEVVALVGFASALLPGLALVVLSPAAWPIPLAALVGLVVTVLAVRRRDRPDRPERDDVSAEAATGTAELEEWLREQHHA